MGRTATVLEVASSSSPGVTYRVWVGEDGPIFCDCPAHKFHRGKPAGERPDCKHMKAIRGDTQTLSTATALATGRATNERRVTRPTNRAIRFIEMQEETTEGTWVTVTDLRRFSNLEV